MVVSSSSKSTTWYTSGRTLSTHMKSVTRRRWWWYRCAYVFPFDTTYCKGVAIRHHSEKQQFVHLSSLVVTLSPLSLDHHRFVAIQAGLLDTVYSATAELSNSLVAHLYHKLLRSYCYVSSIMYLLKPGARSFHTAVLLTKPSAKGAGQKLHVHKNAFNFEPRDY